MIWLAGIDSHNYLIQSIMKMIELGIDDGNWFKTAEYLIVVNNSKITWLECISALSYTESSSNKILEQELTLYYVVQSLKELEFTYGYGIGI